MYKAAELQQVKRKGLGLSFFKLKPERLGRIEHLGLFSFWFSLIAIGLVLPQVILDHQILICTISIVFIIIGTINAFLVKIRRLHDFDMRGCLFV